VSPHERLWQILVLLAGVVSFGTAGYQLVEGWGAFDSLYMTVITVASVGFQEVHPLSTAGRAFTIGLIVLGLGVVAYGLGTITAFWVEGDLSHLWEKRTMERRIAALQDHIVVCGGGETGQHVARELLRTRRPFVCIEIDHAKEDALRRLGDGMLYVIGDATSSDVLRLARVERAQGLVACMANDKDNLFAILSARELNAMMRIVARIVSDDAGPKLRKAGADAVVSVPTIGALRLASAMVRPNVVDFLDAMVREPGATRVQEVSVGPASAGRALGALRLQERTGVVVFALREAGTQRHVFNPPPERALAAGDVLMGCADPAQLATLARILTEG
jgi:voltage-gated potassium channel